MTTVTIILIFATLIEFASVMVLLALLAKEVKASNQLYDKCKGLETDCSKYKCRILEESERGDKHFRSYMTLCRDTAEIHDTKATFEPALLKSGYNVFIGNFIIRQFLTEDEDYNRLLAEELCDKLNETP